MLKRNLISVIAVFLVIFGFEWLWHGHLLMPTYVATASVWRPMDQMQAMVAWCILTKLAFAIVFTWLFAQHYEGKGTMEGVRYGLFIGLIMGLHSFTSYIYLPVSIGLASAWLIGEIIKGVLIGIVLSFTFGKCKGCA